MRGGELNRRVQVTATKSWGPTPTETVGTEVDSQVAAPLKREHPTGTERISLTKECGWKDGDRGGSVLRKTTQGRPLDDQRQLQNRLDTNRPSHGRTYPNKPNFIWIGLWIGEAEPGNDSGESIS